MTMISRDEALDLIRFRATEALEQAGNSETWVKEYWELRNALKDVLHLLDSVQS